VVLVTIQHANPFYDDSYAVNSANLGPYGDAINFELLPLIERKFRAISEGWARGLFGGSTGGWESLAVQIFYPDLFNGAFSSCPDPLDFRAYCLVNIYRDQNAYTQDAAWRRTPRSAERSSTGVLLATMEEANYFELAIGTRGRSGGQFDIWQAVYSPVAADGYPAPIWNKFTGEIDPKVAEYWRQNWDLREHLERNWQHGLGEKLKSKLHIYVGTMDSFYLNNAVVLMEQFLKNTTNPPADAEIFFGEGYDHCFSGDVRNPNTISRLTYPHRFVVKMVDHWLNTAPADADVTSWRY